MIKIVTDSTAYLPQETVEKYDIRVVPLCVHFGKEAFKEGVELSNDEFYARLKEADVLPTTSQPSVGEFYNVFKELADAGHEIIVLTISHKLSGTYSSAIAAQRMLPEAKLDVIDSLSTSIGLQLMVEAAARATAAGVRREDIVAQILEIRDRICVLFVVDTLEYLAKGGRIGNAKALLGTLLKVKPILILQDGAIEPLEQVRIKRKAVAQMLDLVEEHLDGTGPKAKVAITHALVPAEAEEVRDEIASRLGCDLPCISTVGPVIGTHTGPGVVAIAAYA
jgi:DegV family protein with EDD domain